MATALPELEDPAKAKAALAQLWKARQFQEAASLAAKAVALWPHDAEFRAERAKHLLAAGALLEAEAAAREVLQAEASGAQKEAAWIILADALIRQERAPDAREALLVAWNPTDAPIEAEIEVDLYYAGLRGVASVRIGDTDAVRYAIGGDGKVSIRIAVASGGEQRVRFGSAR